MSTEPKVDETSEQQLIRWAMNNRLITEEMNLVKFLNEAGWTTIDQIKNEFLESDIPADFPSRFKARLMNAVLALQKGEPIAKSTSTEKIVVVVVPLQHRYYRDYMDVNDLYRYRGYIDVDDILDMFNPYRVGY